MQLKNNMEAPFKAVIRLNPKETVDSYNSEGEIVGKKPAMPKLMTIQIGRGATASIEDEYWHQLWDKKGMGANEIEEYTEEHLKLQGADKKPLAVTRKEALSLKTIYTYRNMVKNGAIEIVEAAAPKQNQKEMTKMIQDNLGMPDWKPKNEDHLIEMFNKVVG